MSDDRQVKVRTDKFRTHYEAMQGIGAKTLEPESQTKVALLLASYDKVYAATTTNIQQNETANGRLIGSRRILNAEGLARRERLNAVVLNIKLPPKSCLIKKADLPIKDADAGEKDLANRNGVAFLVSQLGPFFDHEVTGEKREMLDTDLDQESLDALKAAMTDAIDLPAEPKVIAVPLADELEPVA